MDLGPFYIFERVRPIEQPTIDQTINLPSVLYFSPQDQTVLQTSSSNLHLSPTLRRLETSWVACRLSFLTGSLSGARFRCCCRTLSPLCTSGSSGHQTRTVRLITQKPQLLRQVADRPHLRREHRRRQSSSDLRPDRRQQLLYQLLKYDNLCTNV